MNPASVSELIEAGIWLQLSGDSEGARQLFERAVNREPSNERAKELLRLTPAMRTRPELAREMNSHFWRYLPLVIPEYLNPFVDRRHPSQPGEPAVDLPVARPVEVGRSEAPPDPTAQIHQLLDAAKELVRIENHAAALELILQAESLAPDDLTVRLLRENSEAALVVSYEAGIGSLDAQPRPLLTPEQIVTLNLDQKSGFVLAQIDGTLSFNDLFSLSGLSRFETARILFDLLDQKAIGTD